MSGIHDCGGDAAAYVLGALEPGEAEAFRAHVEKCAVCRDELEALGAAARVLPVATRQYAAPRDLRRRVLREVRREAAANRRVGPRRGGLTLAGGRVLAAAAATMATAAAVVAGIELSAGTVATVIQARVSGIAGTAQLRVTGAHAELVVRHLAPAGQGHVYEVWLQRGSAAPVPASVLFAVNTAGDADVSIPTAIHGVSAVMVTPEPLGGTARPTRAPVIVARLA